MDWFDNPGKGRNASTLLQDFQLRFAQLSALNWTVLDRSKVLLFVKSFDLLDRNNIGLLLETNEGLTVDWAVIKGVAAGSTNVETRKRRGPPQSVRRLRQGRASPDLNKRNEEARVRPGPDQHGRGTVRGRGSRGAKMVRDLQIS